MLVERGNSRTDRPIPTIRQWGKPGYEIPGRVTMDQNEPVVARLETMEACVLVVSHFASGH